MGASVSGGAAQESQGDEPMGDIEEGNDAPDTTANDKIREALGSELDEATRNLLRLRVVEKLHASRTRTVDGATLRWCRECQQNWPCPTVEAVRG